MRNAGCPQFLEIGHVVVEGPHRHWPCHRRHPPLAIKAAYFLTDPGPDAGFTMFVPGSHPHPGPARPISPHALYTHAGVLNSLSIEASTALRPRSPAAVAARASDPSMSDESVRGCLLQQPVGEDRQQKLGLVG
ncbi:phytanoyl-CoA dioxygenase family protein [Streptomyces sp. NBC_01171]|uniref:phytanoyl-CoA dioxygenase family protein n=1 Tax=Streptomyces sp. NBC_01171 TaxID=2903757 RepID=UPI0038631E5C|nr:phytanoyl-CoA dioxygenase family protein [Streptomyces sp. NBC_01171]